MCAELNSKSIFELLDAGMAGQKFKFDKKVYVKPPGSCFLKGSRFSSCNSNAIGIWYICASSHFSSDARGYKSCSPSAPKPGKVVIHSS